jgi:hypothetical protein
MSVKNGDKARAGCARKKKVIRQKRTRELQKKLAAANPEAKAATTE